MSSPATIRRVKAATSGGARGLAIAGAGLALDWCNGSAKSVHRPLAGSAHLSASGFSAGFGAGGALGGAAGGVGATARDWISPSRS